MQQCERGIWNKRSIRKMNPLTVRGYFLLARLIHLRNPNKIQLSGGLYGRLRLSQQRISPALRVTPEK